jgi:hypothetical protein
MLFPAYENQIKKFLHAELDKMVAGELGFISLPAFRREFVCSDRTTSWFRRAMAEHSGDFVIAKQGKHGWCIFKA